MNSSITIHDYKDHSRADTLLPVFLITSILAVVFQLFIVIFYLLYADLKRRRNFSYRLILLLAFSDIIAWGMRIESSIERMVLGYTAYEYSVEYCEFLAFIWNFFILINVLITLLISSCLMIEVIFHLDTQKYERFYYIFIIVYSAAFSATPLFGHGYGVTDDIKCWITSSEFDFRYLAFYGHLWGVFIFNCMNIVLILWSLRTIGPSHIKLFKKLVWFPIIMLIFWLEPSIRRIFDPNDEDFNLEIMHYIFMPTQGVANAVVYGFVNATVKNKIYEFFTFKCDSLRVLENRTTFETG